MYYSGLDGEYRTEWDPMTTKVEVIEALANGSDAMYWAFKMPWPLSNRDYVYTRRGAICGSKYCLVSRHAEHAQYPADAGGFVRVYPMCSQMVCEAYDEGNGVHGTRFGSLYWDDLRGKIPARLVNWFASSQVPKLIELQAENSKNYPVARVAVMKSQERNNVLPERGSVAPKTKQKKKTKTKSVQEIHREHHEQHNNDGSHHPHYHHHNHKNVLIHRRVIRRKLKEKTIKNGS